MSLWLQYIYIYRCSWYKHAHKCLYFFIVIESDTCTTDESCWLSLESLQTVFLWLCFFLLESMERSRNTLITHVHVRYDLWFHLWNRLCCRNDSKSVHISVLRSVCLIMCLWLSLWMFWLYCVVNQIQIILKQCVQSPHILSHLSQWVVSGGLCLSLNILYSLT